MKDKAIQQIIKRTLMTLIRIYQHSFSLLFGPCCRFSPSCSAYALESIDRFGLVEGGRLSLKRLIRCHPLNPGGFDPVLETTKKS